MGQEYIGSPTHQSTSHTADPCAKFCGGSQTPSYGDYIVAGEQAYLNLEPHNVEQLRVEIRGALKHSHPQEEHQ